MYTAPVTAFVRTQDNIFFSFIVNEYRSLVTKVGSAKGQGVDLTVDSTIGDRELFKGSRDVTWRSPKKKKKN